jgi:hypothetical protein
MATVNKNFRIKHGLVVEGSTATVNGQNILTETGSDQYILDLVGGENLIDSVAPGLSVTDSVLSINRTVVDGWYDANGAAAAAQAAAEATAAGDATTKANAAQAAAEATAAGDATTKANAAQAAAEATASNALTTAVNNLEAYADQAEVDAKAYTDTRETAITTAYQSYADTAEQDAKDYADNLINDASSSSTEVWSAYKTSTEIGLAQTAAEGFATQAIANLVDSAPATLDTLNELAAALQDNPDIISDLQDIAAGKQDTLTAGSNIDITGSTISVTGLDSADISDFNTAALSATSAAYDPAGSAAAAQTAAEDYADDLAVNYDPAGSANAAQAAAELYADTADGVILGNIVNGISAFTTVNINDVTAQVAGTSVGVTGQNNPIYGFPGGTYRAAKLIVKIDNGTHSQISEFLVALDAANNIAVTEYGIVTTNGALADVNFSRKDSNGTIEAKIDVLNNYTVSTNVFGTLIK